MSQPLQSQLVEGPGRPVIMDMNHQRGPQKPQQEDQPAPGRAYVDNADDIPKAWKARVYAETEDTFEKMADAPEGLL